MKAEWYCPGAREGTKIFARATTAQTDIAVGLIDKNLAFRWRDHVPLEPSTLRRDEVGQIRQSVKNAHRRRGGEVGREIAKVKIGLPARRTSEGSAQSFLVWARPIKTMVQQSDRRMQFGQDPLILAPSDSLDGRRPQLKIG